MENQPTTPESPTATLDSLAKFSALNGLPFSDRMRVIWHNVNMTPSKKNTAEWDEETERINNNSVKEIKEGKLALDELIPNLAKFLAKTTLYKEVGSEELYIAELKDFLYNVYHYENKHPEKKKDIENFMFAAMDEGLLDESLVDELWPTIGDLYSG